MKKTTTNWDILIQENKTALVAFVNGASLRRVARSFENKDARSEMWDLERNTTVGTARKRAKNALSRRKISY